MQNFKELKVYQEAYELSKDVYEVIKDWKNMRLQGQLFGSVTSICANLAEMGAFDNNNSQIQKVRTCIGEANESEFWLDFCKDSKLITAEKHKDFTERMIKIRKMLLGLLKSMNGEKHD